MIPILMMIIGGLLIVLAILGLLAYIFQPVYEAFQVVIKRKDDYAHYISPSGQTFLQTRVKRYLMGDGLMFALGCILFFSGLYMGYGPRGFGMLFSVKAGEETAQYDTIESELAEGFDSHGNYVDAEGKIYTHYFVVRGTSIFDRGDLIGDTDAFRVYIIDQPAENLYYIVDGYASSATVKEVTSILRERGIDYEMEE